MIAAAAAAAATHDLTVVMTQKAWDTSLTDPGRSQQRLVEALLATGRPVVVVAVREPYDLAYFSQADTCLATFGYTQPAMESLARVLLGERAPRGRLPVAVPAADSSAILHPYGHGLTWKVIQ
jgi:beta-N-acetylhexosaminidase